MVSINIHLQQRLAPACLAALGHKTHCHLLWQRAVISIILHAYLQHIAPQLYAKAPSFCSLRAERAQLSLIVDQPASTNMSALRGKVTKISQALTSYR